MRAILARYAPRLRYLLLAAPLLLFSLRAYAEEITFENPIHAGDLADLIQDVVDEVQPFALTITATLIIIFGFQYVKAARTGEEAAIKKWKKYILELLAAAAVVAGASVIIDAVVQFATEIK